MNTIAKADSQSEYFFTKGMGYFLQEDFSNAINYFEQSLKGSPKNSAIYYKLGESYYLRGSFHRGVQYLKKAIEIDPDNLAYHLVLADVYISQQEYDLASDVYENMLINNPEATEYYLETAKLFKQMGMLEADKLKTFANNNTSLKEKKKVESKMVSSLKKSISYYNQYEKRTGTSEEISLEKYNIYSFLRKEDEATKELKSLIEAYPKTAKYHVELARYYFQNDKKEKGIEYLELQAKKNPNEAEFHMSLAEMYNINNNKEKADEHLMAVFASSSYSIHNKVRIISGMLQSQNKEKAELGLKMAKKTAQINPSYPQAHTSLGDAYYVNKQPEKAREAYLKALEIDSNTYLVWEQIIFIDAELDDYEGLIFHANRCVLIFPKKPAIWYYLGAAYLNKELNEKAKSAYETGIKFVENNPALEFQFLSQLGDTYNNLKLYEKADSAYEKGLIYDPNSAHILNNYSYFLSLRDEKLDLAKSMSTKLIKIHPNEPTYIDTYAWVLYKLGDYKEAEKQLSIALKNSKDPAILEHYGDVLYRLNQIEEALIYWNKAQGGKGVSKYLDKKIKDKKLYE